MKDSALLAKLVETKASEMSMLDVFTAFALAGLLSNGRLNSGATEESQQNVCLLARNLANHMILAITPDEEAASG